MIKASRIRQMFTASAVSGMKRIEEIETPAYTLAVSNRFMRYQQLSIVSPHVSIPLHKTALSISQGAHFECEDEAVEKEWNEWADKIGFQTKLNTLVRLFIRDGTYCGIVTPTKDGDMTFDPLLMATITIWPKGYNPLNGKSAKPTTGGGEGDVDTLLLMGPPETVVVNEGTPNKDILKKYAVEDIIYGAFCPHDYIITDIKGRSTWGMYGISLLESIEDIIGKYQIIIDGYSSFVRKYGQGRLHVDFHALEELLINNQVDEATELMEDMVFTIGALKENEDIVTIGADIKPLTLSGNISVTDFKESLESDIHVGLLQSGLTMGDTEGTTYSSGYVAEDDRLLTLEAIQAEIIHIVNEQIIPKRLLLKKTLGVKVKLVCNEISKQQVPLAEMIQAYINDIVEFNEVRKEIGYEPLEEQPDNGANPALEAAKNPPVTGIGSGNGLGAGNQPDPKKTSQQQAARKQQTKNEKPAAKTLK